MKIWQTSIAIAVVGAMTFGAISLMSSNDEAISDEQPKVEATTSVQTIRQGLQSHQPEIRLLGSIEPDRQINLVSELSAQIIKEHVRSGDLVEQGDLLLSIDDFNAQQALAQARADIADINTRLALLNSQQRLNEQAVSVETSQLKLLQDQFKQQKAVGVSPQALADLDQQIARQTLLLSQTKTSVENAPLSLKQLEIQKEKLQLMLNSAQRQLSKTKLTAPFTGQITLVHVSEGQAVNPGSPLITLVSNQDMLVKASVPLRLASVRKELSGYASHQSKQSTVRFRHGDAQLMAGTAGLSSWFELTDDNQWISGEIVELTLKTPVIDSALKLPVSALFQDKWIYIVGEEQRLVPLEVSLQGRIREANKDWLIVTPIEDGFTAARILTTRLNNPTSGLKIYEKGVDPEPIVVEEVDNEEGIENSEENDGSDQ